MTPDEWSEHTRWGSFIRAHNERRAAEEARRAEARTAAPKEQVDTPASAPVKQTIIRRPFKTRKLVRRKR